MTENLFNFAKDIYTTTGNDGIVEEIFNRMGKKNGYFVEFGAWDGIKGCNSRRLFERNWSGLFIEADKKKYSDLKNNYRNEKKIICINNFVAKNTEKQSKGILFDKIISKYAHSKKIDFCSIDVDGRDLQIFETFKKYFPTVICIEGGQMLPPYHKKISARLAKRNIQQSLFIMNKTFEKRGYKLLCSYQDSFYIKSKFYDLFNVSSDILTLYFEGLKFIPRRIPFIKKSLDRVGLSNYIIDLVLEKTDYKKYDWDRRGEWVEDQSQQINVVLEEIYNKEIL